MTSKGNRDLIVEKENMRNKLLSVPALKFAELEKEWARYKYLVLLQDPSIYQTIRRRLNDKTEAPVTEFYQMVDQSLAKEENIGFAINAFQHVAGYFKEHWNGKQKVLFQTMLEDYREGRITKQEVKAFLKKEAFFYHVDYLTDSYFFD